MLTFDRISEAHPAAIAGALDTSAVAHHEGESTEHAIAAHNAASMTALALKAGNASLDAHIAGTAVDAGGLLPDVQDNNSWTQVLDEVDPLELLEVQFCNSIAPFLINSRLRPAMRAAVAERCAAGLHRQRERDGGPVRWSPLQGRRAPAHQHGQGRAQHDDPHQSAGEMFETDQILMTAVDTGWITDERPHYEKLRIAAEGWHAPLDLVDGAARVFDPIVQGEAGTDIYGVFLKDFKPAAW
jgi:hypothetical protein